MLVVTIVRADSYNLMNCLLFRHWQIILAKSAALEVIHFKKELLEP